MDLIVTHNNADFDAFASLVAAKKLYPNSRLLLPGSQERAVREFLSLVKDRIQVETEKSCNLSDVKRLIVVDTRHKSRLGIAAKLLENKTIETHIYDHHPHTPYDIKGDRDIFQEVGATVSIIIDILRKRKSAKFTPLEATIMLLAVYEETGSLTYRTTTRLDVDTVSFLLSKGANLEAISSYLNRKLTEEELSFLTSLISSTKVSVINGINIAIAKGTISRFMGELSVIVRKLEDVENFPVLFALFQIGKNLRVIARSRLKEVDVNKILKPFGGGGHKSAASAKIKDTDFETFESKLIRILSSNVKAKILAKDIMSFPVKVIGAHKNIRNAKKILERFGLKGAPVTENRKIVGIITKRDMEKAMKHQYGHASVKGYMSRDVITIKPDTPIHVIQKLMFEKNIGRIPVMNNKKLAGIVTRTDVLKSVHKDIFRKPGILKEKAARFNISIRMKKTLPKKLLKILYAIGRCANRKGYRAFVVGGFVRDMLLGVKNFDIDVVTEGNGILLGKHLANIFKGSVVSYKKFGTSTVIMDWPKGMKKPGKAEARLRIDLATARKESYEKPAALPLVKFSSLKDDLERRDFTINAMASSINQGSFGQLIDFFGGEKDLENGIIRVLADRSFIDDPTRIFRAVRFEQRFGFRIDRYTENLIKHAVREGMFSKTQNQRIRNELMLILDEESPAKALLRMQELHELRFIHKNLRLKNSLKGIFAKIKDASGQYRVDLTLMYLMAFFENLKLNEVESVCEKFVLPRNYRIKLLSYKKNEKRTKKALSLRNLRPSGIYRTLSPLPLEGVLLISAYTKNKAVSRRIKEYIDKYSNIRTKVGGNDLKALGIPPGPLYSSLLAKALDRKIDGGLKTKKDEIDYIKSKIKEMYDKTH